VDPSVAVVYRASASTTGVGAAYAGTSILSVQFGAALAGHLFGRIGPFGAVSWRLVGASLVMLAITRPWGRHWTRSELRAALLFGAVFTAMSTSLYLAIDRLPLGTAITLEFLGPLGVAIVTATGWTTRAWAVPAAAGVALLSATLSAGDASGVALALVAACCWAGYILLSSRMGRHGTGLSGLAVGCAFGAVLVLPAGAAEAGRALLVPSTAALGLLVGVLSSAIPYSLDVLALRRLPTAVFGVLTSANPGVAALAGWLVLGQAMQGRQLAGVALVMAASVGVAATPVRRGRPRAMLAEAALTPAAR
jgi:inner membrane transporter RhtA